jgi:hypothetical protein
MAKKLGKELKNENPLVYINQTNSKESFGHDLTG